VAGVQVFQLVMDNDAFYIAFHEEGDDVFDMVFVIDEGKRYPCQTEPLGDDMVSQAIRQRRGVRFNRTPPEIEFASQDVTMRFGNRGGAARFSIWRNPSMR
jgi:hypothetical protein